MGIHNYVTQYEHGTASRDNPEAHVTVFVPAADLVGAVSSWIGGYQYVNGNLTYVVPEAYARNPGLFAQSIDYEPISPEAKIDPATGDFDQWRITVHYGIPDQPGGEEVARWTYRVGAEELVLPKAGFTVSGEKLKDTDPQPVKIVPLIELQATFFSRPPTDPSTWSYFVGAVNADPFYGFAAETLMFNSVDSDYAVSADGKPTSSETYSFTARPTGWNKIYRPGSGWVTVSPSIYDLKLDFSGLAAFSV